MNREKQKTTGGWLPLFLLVCLFGVLSTSRLFALDPRRAIEQYVVEEWTAAAGLPGNSIVAVAQTGDGYLWVADRRKLCRFDGVQFSSFHMFNIPGSGYSQITALQTDNDGKLWVGTRGGGLYKYDNEVFEIFSQRDGLSSLFISFLFCDHQNNLWIGTEEGHLNRLKDRKVTVFDRASGLSESHIYSIAEDSKGNLWVGTRGGGLFRYVNGKFNKINIPGYDIIDVVSIREDAAGGLWLGTNRGLVRWDGNRFDFLGRTGGMTGHAINRIIQDSDRNLWIGTGGGLFRLRQDISGNTIVDKSMGGSVVRGLFEDQEKSIWIATDGRGLTRLRDGKIRTFSAESGLPHEYVVFMHETPASKDLWVGTMDGLTRFEKGVLSREAMSTRFSDAVVGPIAHDSQNRTWFGTYGSGLYRTDGNKPDNFTIRDGLLSDTIVSLLFDSRQRLWIGSDRGLNSYRDGVFSAHHREIDLLKNEIQCIYEDSRQTVWFGTDKGIVRYKDDRFSTLNVKDLPVNLMVSYIYRDSRNVTWIATKGNGLIRLREDDTFRRYSTRDGLYSNVIYQLFEDNNGFLWMSCERGIFKILRDDLDRVAAGELKKVDFIYYGKNDGMKSPECSRWGQHSSIRTGDGKLLFGTTKGIAIVDPENIRISKIAPPVALDKIIVNDLAIKRDKKKYVYPVIDYIQFHFRASTLIAPGRIKFKYRLEGFDDKWTEVKITRIKMANYRKLRPGQYTFHVISANTDGIWAEKGTTFTFTYAPRFTQSLWFRLGILFFGLIFIGAVTFFVRRYIHYRRQKNKYKDSHLDEEKVQDCKKTLLYTMDIDKLYRDDALSLQTLAKKINVTPHILSQVINEQLNKNFSDFVNGFRIDEAKKLLEEADEDTSILQICYDVGFNSKSAFYRAFKKFTDMTPSQFQKNLKNNKKK